MEETTARSDFVLLEKIWHKWWREAFFAQLMTQVRTRVVIASFCLVASASDLIMILYSQLAAFLQS
jgi:hypothetical protein